jgi:hypothetical protein
VAPKNAAGIYLSIIGDQQSRVSDLFDLYDPHGGRDRRHSFVFPRVFGKSEGAILAAIVCSAGLTYAAAYASYWHFETPVRAYIGGRRPPLAAVNPVAAPSGKELDIEARNAECVLRQAVDRTYLGRSQTAAPEKKDELFFIFRVRTGDLVRKFRCVH